MRSLALVIIVCMTCFRCFSGEPGEWLNRLQRMNPKKQQHSIDSFLLNTPKFPCFENDTTVYFFYHGPGHSIDIAGDFNNWRPVTKFHQIDGTSLWFLRLYFRTDARIEYKLVLNKTDWILDPLNPTVESGGFGNNSCFTMPHYDSSPMILEKEGVESGKTIKFSARSRFLNNTREITCYVPPNYDPLKNYPLILFHDGPDYIRLAYAITILNNLIHAKKIQPAIAVFVPPLDRTEEYAGKKQQKFVLFIIKELIPAIEERFSITKEPEFRAVAGASYGGNISLVLATRFTKQFGLVAAQSGYVQRSVFRDVKNKKPLSLTLYLDMGIYDIPVLIPRMQDFYSLASSKGYKVWFRQTPQGHNWKNWSDHLPEVLVYFFGEK